MKLLTNQKKEALVNASFSLDQEVFVGLRDSINQGEKFIVTLELGENFFNVSSTPLGPIVLQASSNFFLILSNLPKNSLANLTKYRG